MEKILRSQIFLTLRMANGKCGRPKKEVLKTTRFELRFTAEQKERLKNNAKQQRYSSVSSYIIDKLFTRNLSKNQVGLDLADINQLRKIIKELNPIGVNINQIAKKINSLQPDIEDSILHYELQKVIDECQKIALIRKQIEEIIKFESQKLLGEYKENIDKG